MGPYLIPPSGGEDITMKTTKGCPECGEDLVFTEEIYLLQIVQPHILPTGLVLHPVLNEEGDFLHEPYFMHFMCWEKVEEDLRETVKDEPPVIESFAPLRCKYCESSICEWEVCGSLSMGEIHISKRAPEGVHGEELVEMAEPDLICLYCLLLINEGITEFWEEGVSQNGECGDCIQGRCFRLPEGTCACPCHYAFEQEEDDYG